MKRNADFGTSLEVMSILEDILLSLSAAAPGSTAKEESWARQRGERRPLSAAYRLKCFEMSNCNTFLLYILIILIEFNKRLQKYCMSACSCICARRLRVVSIGTEGIGAVGPDDTA